LAPKPAFLAQMEHTTKPSTLTPAQVEFFAAEELVEFIPVVDAPAIPTLSGSLGPFIAGRATQIPVWLALQMEERGWGRTALPKWLAHPQLLETLLEAEKNNPDEFCPVPQHYMELTQLFLRSCQKTDRAIPHQVLSLVDMLWSIRAEKRRGGIEGADLVNTLAFRMDNLTLLEANHFRMIAQLALDFNLDAKMAFEGETPPDLESLNARRGNLVQLLGTNRVHLDTSSASEPPLSLPNRPASQSASRSDSNQESLEEDTRDSRRTWMGGDLNAPPSSKLRKVGKID